MDKFPISPEKWAAKFEVIQADRTSGLTSATPPLFFLHAGQPGSGKTVLNDQVADQLAGNLLECNADTLRNEHPDIELILQEPEDDYPDLTWQAANSWNNALIETGVTRRYNLLIETTLRNADQALETLARMKANGYITHLHVLVVPYWLSWVGIHIRFEGYKALKGFARAVSEADHDDRFARLPETLPIVLKSPHLDKAILYQRQLLLPPPKPPTVEIVTETKENIVEAFRDIRNKPMDEQAEALFNHYCTRIVQYMEDRDAGRTHIEAFQGKASRLALK